MPAKTITGCITSIEYRPDGLAESFTVTPPPPPKEAGTSFRLIGTKLAPIVEKAQEGCFEVEVTYQDDDKAPYLPTVFKRLTKNKKCCPNE